MSIHKTFIATKHSTYHTILNFSCYMKQSISFRNFILYFFFYYFYVTSSPIIIDYNIWLITTHIHVRKHSLLAKIKKDYVVVIIELLWE